MRDDWYGYRDPFTGEPTGDKSEWTMWDYALCEAFEVVERITLDDGSFQMDQDDDAVSIQAIKTIDKFTQSVERITGKDKYKAQPGERFKPRIVSRRKNGEFTLYSEWVKSKSEES